MIILSSTETIQSHASKSQPKNNVTRVTGTPTLQSSPNPISTRAARAASTTIRFATLPRIVKLPARVEAIASTSHARRGSSNVITSGLNSRTAGTLETRFDSTAVTTVTTAGLWRFATAAQASHTLIRPHCPIPTLTTNTPWSLQLPPGHTVPGFTRRVKGVHAAPAIATIAIGTPARNATSITRVALIVLNMSG